MEVNKGKLSVDNGSCFQLAVAIYIAIVMAVDKVIVAADIAINNIDWIWLMEKPSYYLFPLSHLVLDYF